MTTLSNVHPAVLASVQAKLPKGAVILAAMAESETTSIFMVEHGGQTRRVPMPKANAEQIFHNRAVEVDAQEGDSWESVMKTFSDKYKLNLVPGVDFDLSSDLPETVSFGDASSVMLGIGFLEDSITLVGGVTIQVNNQDAVKRPAAKVTPLLSTERIGLALASTILEGKGKVFTKGQLSSAFSKKVIAYLKPLELANTPTVDDVGTAEVIDDVFDGISRVAVIKTLRGVTLPIRYTSTDEDRPF